MLEHLPNFPQINGTLVFVVLNGKPREARWAWELRGFAEGRGLTVSRCSQGADAEDPADQHQSPTKHQGPGGGGQGEDPEGAAPAWPRGWGRALGGGNPSVLLSSDLLLGSQGASRELSGLLHSSLLLANTWGLELSFPPSSTWGSLQKSPACSHQAE